MKIYTISKNIHLESSKFSCEKIKLHMFIHCELLTYSSPPRHSPNRPPPPPLPLGADVHGRGWWE